MSMSCKISGNESETEKLDVSAFRANFPIFGNHPDLIYFDSASTTQKPQVVVDTLLDYYTNQCANSGRASYSWSTQLNRAIEESRAKVAQFINCEVKNLVFTSGATDSLNMAALTYGLNNLEDGDEVMLCPQDHKSAVLPWYNVQAMLKERGKNITIKHFAIHEVGDYDLKSVKEAFSERTRVVAMAHIHHVFGLDMEVSKIREIVGKDVVISLDASQSIGHTTVDAANLDVDFISFSGHKMFAAPGVGGLYINPRVEAKIKPVRLGGQSPVEIKDNGLEFTSKSMHQLIECGTLNIPAILSLGKAVDFISATGIAAIEAQLSDLTVYLWQKLTALPGIVFAPGIGICRCDSGFGIISFRFEQLASLDLTFLLDSEQIFVRAGDHCTQKNNEEDDYLRVSMHAYNTREEVDQLVEVLEASLA
jgi:cysteine desulfurase/selenocysteine lyase